MEFIAKFINARKRDSKHYPNSAWNKNKPNLPISFSEGMPESLAKHLTINKEANTVIRRTPQLPLPHLRGFVNKAQM